MEGQGLAEPIARSGLFPAAARQMFRVGEETGTLDQQLEVAAAYYGRELETKLERATALFEPAIIIFMGVVVGFVAVALISAMYGIYNQVRSDEGRPKPRGRPSAAGAPPRLAGQPTCLSIQGQPRGRIYPD